MDFMAEPPSCNLALALATSNDLMFSEATHDVEVPLEPLEKIDSTNSEGHLVEIKNPVNDEKIFVLKKIFMKFQKSQFTPQKQDPCISPLLNSFGHTMLTQLTNNIVSVPFRFPVDPYEDGVLDYYQVVKNPMDLQTMRLRLDRGKYRSKEEFYSDLDLIVTNSKLYHQFNSQFLSITKRFQTLCAKVRRIIDPKNRRKDRQITNYQVENTKKNIGRPKKSQQQIKNITQISQTLIQLEQEDASEFVTLL